MKTIVWFGFVLGALSAAAEVIVTKPRLKVALRCGVDTFANILEWYREGDLLYSVSGKTGFQRKGKVDVVSRSKVKSGTKLEISPVREDAGKFICNADGRFQKHVLLVVSVWASSSAELQLGSEATLHCEVSGLDPGSATQWTRPDGSPHSGTLSPVTHSDKGTWMCTFSQDGVMYNQSLAIEVQDLAPETDAPSPSQNSENVVTTVPHGFTQPPSVAVVLLGLIWWVWVAVGVGCLAVLLLMVFVIVLCKRITRKKKNFHAMKNSRQPLQPKNYCKCDCSAAAAKPKQGRRREKPSAPPLQPLQIL